MTVIIWLAIGFLAVVFIALGALGGGASAAVSAVKAATKKE